MVKIIQAFVTGKELLFKSVLTQKNTRIVKLIAFFLLTGFCLHAGTGGYSQTVTMTVKNEPLSKVFTEIEKQTGYSFAYRGELLESAKPVNLNVKQVPLEKVLDLCFTDQRLTYKIVEHTVIVIKKEENENRNTLPAPIAIPVEVKGKLVNEEGEPVAGASIRIKGTGQGTSTDEHGAFILPDVESNDVLVISGAAIETKEVNINGRADLATLVVKKRVTESAPVIVYTGYDKTPKERFVGSYSQLDSTAYSRRAGMDIISRLDGTINGVLFDKKKSGIGLLATMQVRGISTLQDPKSPSAIPLIVVDNFPFRQDLNTINPDDVESITVLKDAAATSIWGAQAGNGVIVITTKKGRYDQPMRISVSSNLTLQGKPDLYYYPQMSNSDLIDLEMTLFSKGRYEGDLNNTSSRPVISPVVEILAKRRAGKISAADSANQIGALRGLDLRDDLDKYIYRTSISQQHYINLAGGNRLFNYSFSGGYIRRLNDIQNSKPDGQFTINSNTGFRPIESLEVTTGIYYSESVQKSTGFSLPNKIYPYAQLADAYGQPLAVSNERRMAYLDTVGDGKLFDWRYRPLEEPGLTDRKDIIRYFALNIGTSYRFTPWLKAELSYQYATQSNNSYNFHGVETYFTRDLINQYTNLSEINPDLRNPVPVGGILDVSDNQSISQNIRGRLNINKNFGARHQLTAFIGTEVSELRYPGGNTNRFYGYSKETGVYKSSIDYITRFLLYGGASGTQPVPNGSRPILGADNRFVSFLGNASYTYGGRYTFYASARKDGSNVFGVNTNKKWKPLWSAGASWDISKERFFRVQWLSSLRLRASYGYSGNPGNASGFATMTYSGNAEYTNLLYATIGDAPNPDLKWEKVGIINTGIDFSLLNNRISGNIDVWQKKVTDIISPTPFAPSTGIINFTTNFANLKGNGFELSLNSKNINGVFTWQTGLGLSYAKMRVTKLYISAHTAQDFVSYGLNAAEGMIAYGMASYRWAGLDPLTGDPLGYLNKQVSKDYGAIANDSVGNQVFHGSAVPLYYGYMSNSFSWKKFTLSANISFRFDFYFRKPTINYTDLINRWKGHSDYAMRWQKPGDENFTNVPSLLYSPDDQRDRFYQYAEVNVLRGDNIRLQDLRLQYRWDKKKGGKMPFNNINLFMYVNNINLILWRKNKSGLDPDFTGGLSFITPPSKTWTGGISINF